MGRKSSLTERQWSEVERRIIDGEGVRALAKEFKVSPSAISSRFSKRKNQIKDVAKQFVAAETSLKKLNVDDQIAAQRLICQLRSVSMQLAGYANFGAMTAHRLSGIAHQQIEKLSEHDPFGEDSAITLRGIAAYTEVANKAAQGGLNLLAANKQLPADVSDDESATPRPEALDAIFNQAMSWAEQQFSSVADRPGEFRDTDPFSGDDGDG